MRGVTREVPWRISAAGIAVVMFLAVVCVARTEVVRATDNAIVLTDRIALGDAHTCAIHNDNHVWCWGANSDSQLGLGPDFVQNSYTSPQQVPEFGEPGVPVQIAAGRFHTCVLLSDATVWCWGHNGYGSVGGAGIEVASPRQVSLDARAQAVYAGGGNSCALLEDATLTCWGANSDGQLGINVRDDDAHTLPTPIPPPAEMTPVHSLSIGTSHMCARAKSNRIWCWGSNATGQAGVAQTTTRLLVPQAKTMEAAFGAHVGAGDSHSCVALDDAVKCFGSNSSDQAPNVYVFAQPVQDVALGGHFGCVRLEGAVPRCWGSNSDSQLGLGGASPQQGVLDYQVAGLDASVIDIAAGRVHACAVTTTGDVKCWGANDSGQLGITDLTDQHTAGAVSGINIVPLLPEVPEVPDVVNGVGGQNEQNVSDNNSSPLQESSRSGTTVEQVAVPRRPLISPVRLKRGRSISARRLVRAVSLEIPKKSQGKMRISIVKGSKNCRFSGTSIRAVRTGKCTVSVKLLPKKGKSTTRKTTITVTP